ncbi:pH-response regulator protein palA/rim20 [Dimargaris cristalligena]|nr:pH-response regulator protein palA/rim20 [Dimargaris cristalligena]
MAQPSPTGSSPSRASNLLALPLKYSLDQTVMSTGFMDCIINVYGEPVQPYTKDLEQWDDLCAEARHVNTPGPGQLRLLLKYYAQLTHGATKFPPDVNGSPGFAWTPCFVELLPDFTRRAIPAAAVATAIPHYPSLVFERANVLFNIAAYYSHLALQEDRLRSPGLRHACNYFQQAAGALTHLKDQVVPALNQALGSSSVAIATAAPPTSSAIHSSTDSPSPSSCRPPTSADTPLPSTTAAAAASSPLSSSSFLSLSASLPPPTCAPADFQPRYLDVFILTMLAQAQECFWQKAVTDRMKNSLVAKLAVQTAAFYAQAGEAIRHSSIHSQFPARWSTHLAIKQAHFEAAAQFRQSCVDLDADQFGQEISRLQWAQQRVRTALAAAANVSFPSSFSSASSTLSSSSSFTWLNDGGASSSSPTRSSRKSSNGGGGGNLPGLPTDHPRLNIALTAGGIQRASEIDTIQHALADLRSLDGIIATNLQRARKDNDVIYMTLIPEFDQLPAVTGVAMVQPTPPPEVSDPIALLHAQSPLGPALLSGLLPFVIHQAVSVYFDRKHQYVEERITEPLQFLTAQGRSSLEALGIDDALAPFRPPHILPISIEKIAHEMQSQGGITFADQLFQQANQLAEACTDLIQTVLSAVTENRVPGGFNDPSAPSITAAWQAALTRHEQTVADRRTVDQATMKRLASWKPFFKVLGGPKEHILAAIPSTPIFLEEDELAVIEDVEQTRVEFKRSMDNRVQIVETARQFCAQDDIAVPYRSSTATATVTTTVTETPTDTSQFEGLFAEQLKRYEPYLAQIQTVTTAQQDTLTELSHLLGCLADIRSRHPAFSQREKAFANLKLARRKYFEMIDLGQQSIQYYTQVQEELLDLQDRIRDLRLVAQADSMHWIAAPR